MGVSHGVWGDNSSGASLGVVSHGVTILQVVVSWGDNSSCGISWSDNSLGVFHGVIIFQVVSHGVTTIRVYLMG